MNPSPNSDFYFTLGLIFCMEIPEKLFLHPSEGDISITLSILIRAKNCPISDPNFVFDQEMCWVQNSIKRVGWILKVFSKRHRTQTHLDLFFCRRVLLDQGDPRMHRPGPRLPIIPPFCPSLSPSLLPLPPWPSLSPLPPTDRKNYKKLLTCKEFIKYRRGLLHHHFFVWRVSGD